MSIEANEFAEVVVCDLTRITRPDAAVIDALARARSDSGAALAHAPSASITWA